MASFTTNPVRLEELLRDCERGILKLPDFQRSWVWDEERIRSLIASISLSFPVGALMTLEIGGAVDFKARPVQGAPDDAETHEVRHLLLDGQQRMTSLYQTCMRRRIVETVTARHKKVKRWYYLDIEAALDPQRNREDAVVGVPEDRIQRADFGRTVLLDLSSPECEYKEAMFPVNQVFDWDAWQERFGDYWIARDQAVMRELFKHFKDNVLQNFKNYQVPVIALDRDTSREAVCLVFEKVNTGGKPLDAFELVTAMYSAQGFELRKDWLGENAGSGRQSRLSTFGRAADQDYGLLEKIAPTDFLQAISLIHTRDVRDEVKAEDPERRDLPPVSATRQSLLNLPLDAYKTHAVAVEEGFKTAVKFLRMLRIYGVHDLPYQSQFVPLAAILMTIGDAWENAEIRARIARWYWCGVFGELYGSAVESRIAKDIVEVPIWLAGGERPSTMEDPIFRVDRLRTMRTRLSAAYKGINAMLMGKGAKDFRSGQDFDQTVFFDESVDIHHVFPRDWCRQQGISQEVYDSIINKTPLTARTNRILGGAAPSEYLAGLERGGVDSPPIAAADIDSFLRTHLIDPELLRADDFEGFYRARQAALLRLIEEATGQAVYGGEATNEPEVDVPDETVDAPILDAAD